MGNYRFRLSDMIPNAWFYKLKDMGKTRNPTISHSFNRKHPPNTTPPPLSPKQQHPHLSFPKRSSCFSHKDKPFNLKSSDTHFHDSPTQSRPRTRWRRGRRRKTNTETTTSSVSTTDIIINVDSKSSFSTQTFEKFVGSRSAFPTQKFEKFDWFDSVSELQLPPILTKPPKHDDFDVERKEPEKFSGSSTRLEERNVHGSERSPVRRLSSSLATQGLKIRANSPRLASKKIQAYCRKSMSMNSPKMRKNRVADSFVVVKSSLDPQRDFRDSMVEMIVENNIRASKELEELLACYLSLNSDEYHDMIVKVFEQIWFDLTGL